MKRQIGNTTNDFLNKEPWFVVPIFPFNTSIGLKPDNTNAGYNPEKNTPIKKQTDKPNPEISFSK